MKYIIFIILIAIFSCQKVDRANRTNVSYTSIDFDRGIKKNRPLKLSEIATNIEYILLETKSESLVEENPGITVSENYIFISQKGQILQFDSLGKFLRKVVKIGKGPGEGFSRCFDIDAKNNLLYMYNNFAKSIVTYSIDNGTFLNSQKDPVSEFSTNKIFYYNGLLVATALNNSKNWFFAVHSLNTNECVFKMPNLYKFDNPTLNSIDEYTCAYFQNYNDTLLFKEMFNDTIYSTLNFKKISIRYIITATNKITYNDYQSFLSNPRINHMDNSSIIIGRFIESPKKLFFNVFKADRRYLYVYAKTSKELHIYNGEEIINDIDEGSNFKLNWSSQSNIYFQGSIYCLIDPLSFKELIKNNHIASNKFGKIRLLDENSNPILMKVKLNNN